MELLCSVQKYEWGKLGSESLVAKLAHAINQEEINTESPYAELWMGEHPSGPSRIKATNQPLKNYISEQPDCLGLAVSREFSATLPFLFKVLSVRKALSIQAHPSKRHAEELFENHPEIYKDPNHKPELAIAVTDFQALCGFRPCQEIQKFLCDIPQLAKLIGKQKVAAFVSDGSKLRDCFEALMASSEDKVKAAIASYLLEGESTREKEIVQELNKQFPGDVGVLCVFWLNYVNLAPGEALYLGPNEPHAYLYGNCVECMANSDNVVRAGLTPKFRDVTTLCDMLTYKSYHPSEIKFQPKTEDAFTKLFNPPVKDFAVAMISIPAGTKYETIPRSSASILLAIEGTSTKTSTTVIKPGTVLFIPALEILDFKTESDLTLYQAFCNVENINE